MSNINKSWPKRNKKINAGSSKMFNVCAMVFYKPNFDVAQLLFLYLSLTLYALLLKLLLLEEWDNVIRKCVIY